MLSTIILVSGVDAASVSSEAIVRTLVSLVPAAIDGLLRDVALAGPRSRADLAEIAAHAGCALVEGAAPAEWLAEALEAARGPSVFLLAAGFAPEQGYIEEISDVVAGNSDRRSAVLRVRSERVFGRLFPMSASIVGLIGDRRQLLAARATDLGALARAAGPARTLRTRARQVV